MLIGVISDTHGKFHPAITQHFAGVAQILHAGDIGNTQIVGQLEAIAPVLAVTGNVDWGTSLDRVHPRNQHVTLGNCTIWMTHIGGKPGEMHGRLPTPRPDVFICGHSHIALVERRDEVLYLNPGSAGAPRFGRPSSLALLRIEDGRAEAEIVWL